MADEHRRASIAARPGYWICGVLWPAVGFGAAWGCPADLWLLGGDASSLTAAEWMFPMLSQMIGVAALPVFAACAASSTSHRAAWCAGLATGLASAWAAAHPFLGIPFGALAAGIAAGSRALATIRASGGAARRCVVGGWLLGSGVTWLSPVIALATGRKTLFLPLALAYWAVSTFVFWLATVVADETARGDRAAAEAGTP